MHIADYRDNDGEVSLSLDSRVGTAVALSHVCRHFRNVAVNLSPAMWADMIGLLPAQVKTMLDRTRQVGLRVTLQGAPDRQSYEHIFDIFIADPLLAQRVVVLEWFEHRFRHVSIFCAKFRLSQFNTLTSLTIVGNEPGYVTLPDVPIDSFEELCLPALLHADLTDVMFSFPVSNKLETLRLVGRKADEVEFGTELDSQAPHFEVHCTSILEALKILGDAPLKTLELSFPEIDIQCTPIRQDLEEVRLKSLELLHFELQLPLVPFAGHNMFFGHIRYRPQTRVHVVMEMAMSCGLAPVFDDPPPDPLDSALSESDMPTLRMIQNAGTPEDVAMLIDIDVHRNFFNILFFELPGEVHMKGDDPNADSEAALLDAIFSGHGDASNAIAEYSIHCNTKEAPLHDYIEYFLDGLDIYAFVVRSAHKEEYDWVRDFLVKHDLSSIPSRFDPYEDEASTADASDTGI